MLFPEYNRVGYKFRVDSKTRICELPESGVLDEKIPPGEEGYLSVYRFDSSVDALESLGNLPPETKVYCDCVFFDFDSKDLQKALDDVKTLAERLDSIKAEYSVWFSGNKGFHLYLPSSQIGLLPTSDVNPIKRFAEALAEGLTTFDPSIYNKSRVLRAPFTLNKGAQLTKIPVSLTMRLDDILTEAATKCSKDLTWGAWAPELNGQLVAFYKKVNEVKPETPSQSRVVLENESGYGKSVFLQAEEGRRNETAYTVARRLARRGFPISDAQNVMRDYWNKTKCNPSLTGDELSKIVANAYSKGTNEVVEIGNLEGRVKSIEQTVTEVSKEFQNKKAGFLTGYEMLDKYTMGFEEEELIFIAARSGNFKSCFLTNILQRGSKLAKKPALLLSMEMGPRTLVPRMIQQSERMRKKEVIETLKLGRGIGDFKQASVDFEYLKTVYLSNLSTEQLLEILDYTVEKTGSLCAIGIDYLGLFRGCNNNTERTAKQAQDLKTVVAKAAKCPVFCLAQAKQIYEGRGGDVELDRTCVKDSDSVLDLGDYSIGMWANWQVDQTVDTAPEKKYIFGKFLKSRGMDDELYGIDPYFGLKLHPEYMYLEDVVHVPNPPRFNQKDGNKHE